MDTFLLEQSVALGFSGQWNGGASLISQPASELFIVFSTFFFSTRSFLHDNNNYFNIKICIIKKILIIWTNILSEPQTPSTQFVWDSQFSIVNLNSIDKLRDLQ